jgi:hypothetical protein
LPVVWSTGSFFCGLQGLAGPGGLARGQWPQAKSRGARSWLAQTSAASR